MAAGDRLGEEKAQRERGVGELWAVAGSASRIQVAVAGVMRRDPGDPEHSSRTELEYRMWPIFGSQIGNVG